MGGRNEGSSTRYRVLSDGAPTSIISFMNHQRATARDVAAFIAQTAHHVDEYKLQKLLYYAQAWSLVWDDEPLFSDDIQAWIQGPVTKSVWHERKYSSAPSGDPAALTSSQTQTILAVIDFYDRMSGPELVELSHREMPWRKARGQLRYWQRSNQTISPESIREYFGSMTGNGEKRISDPVRRGAWTLLQTPQDRIDDLYASASEAETAAFRDWLDGAGVADEGAIPLGE